MLADQVEAGAKANGAKVESIYLHGLDIRACDACDLCGEGNGCVINDDMQALYPKVEAADAIVLSSPVYWFTFSAQMKLFIDRCYAYQVNGWKEMRGKQYALIPTYGDTDLYTSGGINAISTFETMCRFLNAEIAGMVYGTMSDVGDAEQQPGLMEQAYKLGQNWARRDFDASPANSA